MNSKEKKQLVELSSSIQALEDNNTAKMILCLQKRLLAHIELLPNPLHIAVIAGSSRIKKHLLKNNMHNDLVDEKTNFLTKVTIDHYVEMLSMLLQATPKLRQRLILGILLGALWIIRGKIDLTCASPINHRVIPSTLKNKIDIDPYNCLIIPTPFSLPDGQTSKLRIDCEPVPINVICLPMVVYHPFKRELDIDVTTAKQIGQGYFGTVYQVQIGMQTPVAIKKVKLNKLKKYYRLGSPSAQAIVDWEITQLKRSMSPHIVCLKGIGMVNDVSSLMVMELCPGSLEKREHHDVFQRWCWFWETSAALVYLHAQGLVHRDLRPGNILLNYDDVAKLADFGFSQPGDSLLLMLEDSKIPGLVVWLHGNSLYASPEAREANRQADLGLLESASRPAADIYSLGLIMAELITGMLPDDIRIGLPDRKSPLLEIAKLCLAYDPEDRPSAQMILSYLEQNINTHIHPYPILVRLTQRLGILAHEGELFEEISLDLWISQLLPDTDNWEEFWLSLRENPPDSISNLSDRGLQRLSMQLSAVNDDSTQIAIWVGEGGAGKTTMINQLLYQQWKSLRAWLKNIASSSVQSTFPMDCPSLPVVLCHDTCTITMPLKFTADILSILLQDRYQLSERDIESIKHYPIIFILDGADDLLLKWVAQANESNSSLWEQLGLSDWHNARLWITCRQTTFSRFDQSLNTVFGDNNCCWHLLPLSHWQITSYLTRQCDWSAEEGQTCLEKLAIAEAAPWLRNPFILSFFASVWENSLKGTDWQKLTPIELLPIFIEHWLKKSIDSLKSSVYYADVFKPVLQHLRPAKYKSAHFFEGLTESFFIFASEAAKQLNKTLGENDSEVQSPWWYLDTLLGDQAKKVYTQSCRGLATEEKSTCLTESNFSALMQREFKKAFVFLAPLRWWDKKHCVFSQPLLRSLLSNRLLSKASNKNDGIDEKIQFSRNIVNGFGIFNHTYCKFIENIGTETETQRGNYESSCCCVIL